MRHTSAEGSGGHCGLNDEGACYVFFSAGITDAVVEVAAMLLEATTATEAAVEALEPSATTFATGANCQSLM